VKLLATNPDTDRKRTARDVALAVLVHAGLIALLVHFTQPRLDVSDDTGGEITLFLLDGGGGGGGGSEQVQEIAFEKPAPAPEPVKVDVVPPEPELVVPTPVIPPPAPPPPDTVSRDTASQIAAQTPVVSTVAGAGAGTGGGPGSGTGTGGGNGSGNGTGTGSGSGPGSGGGDGSGGRMPSPRMVLLPPKAPASFRGKTVTLQLAVDSAGVVREVQLKPRTGNEKFDDELRHAALEWRFRPGTDAAGRAVAKLFDVVFVF
jgi:periplasmic protein TonB